MKKACFFVFHAYSVLGNGPCTRERKENLRVRVRVGVTKRNTEYFHRDQLSTAHYALGITYLLNPKRLKHINYHLPSPSYRRVLGSIFSVHLIRTEARLDIDRNQHQTGVDDVKAIIHSEIVVLTSFPNFRVVVYTEATNKTIFLLRSESEAKSRKEGLDRKIHREIKNDRYASSKLFMSKPASN